MDIYTVVYLNNILIYSEDLENYQWYIKNVLEQFLVRQLRCKPEKYQFYQKKIDFLGFIVEVDGVQIDSGKVKKIFDWSESKNLKNL